MSWRGVFGHVGYILVGALTLGALVHFLTILLIPQTATGDAFARLSELGPPGAAIALPQAAPNARKFPFGDPAVASAVCRYDLTAGPVRVRSPTGRAGFASISFHSRRGAVFYALTDRAATHGVMEAVIVTPAQLRALVAADDEDNPSEDLRIVSPTEQGFVLARVFSEAPSLYPSAQGQASATTCALDAPK